MFLTWISRRDFKVYASLKPIEVYTLNTHSFLYVNQKLHKMVLKSFCFPQHIPFIAVYFDADQVLFCCVSVTGKSYF